MSVQPGLKNEPYAAYGRLLHAWRNEIKHTFDMMSAGTGISKDRLQQLELGREKPTWAELEVLAKHLYVSVRDLLPYENDLDRGCKFLRDKNATHFEQTRSGRVQYTYWNRVMTSALPNIKPVELLLHLTKRDEVVMNRGHFFHQYTQVLHGGPVAFLWEWEGEVHEEVFTTGDSWIIPGFVPHAFYSPEPAQLGRILALTLGQSLTGDASQELALIGKDNVHRIVKDDLDYYPKGASV